MLDLFEFSLQTKMLIRLYALPSLFLIGALLLIFMTGQYHGDRAGVSLSETINAIIYECEWWGSTVLLIISCGIFIYSSFRLWKWENGTDTEICHMCGGMQTVKNGRFGAYYKCLACGFNRSIYR